MEPWVSRLESWRPEEGQVLVEDKDTATTVLVSSAAFLGDHRDLAKKIVQANKELTDWILKNPDEAKKLAAAEVLAETRNQMSPPKLIAKAWKRIIFTSDIPCARLGEGVRRQFLEIRLHEDRAGLVPPF